MELEDIDTIAVLGAGTMGHGIAEVAALAGYQVNMRDINEELVQEGYDQIEWSLDKLEEKERIDPGEAEAALERIDPLVDLEATVADADFLIEAVPERMDIKREVYSAVLEYAPDEMLFTTNTSSLSITELSEVTDRPDRFCGMHFFNPPVRMPLVEVIAGAHTSEEMLSVTEALAEDFGKTPVRVHRDEPGFIVNRVLAPLMNEAAWMVTEGEATVKTVDSTAKFDLGLPMGVFELTDQVGIDIVLDILEYLHEQLGPAYAPAPLLAEKVEAEELGRKSGVGFYDYESGEAVSIPADAGDSAVRRRLVAAMANEVAKLLEVDVAAVDAIDNALRLGGGFPDGPAAMADDIGLETLLEALETRFDATEAARYEPADELRRAAEAGGFRPASDEASGTDFQTIRLEYPGDNVGKIVLDRPERMNSVSAELIEELDRAMDHFENDPDVRAILVVGAGDRAFSAGADVQSMAGGGTDRYAAVDLSQRGQAVFGRLAESPLPTVAGIDGYCLGGGMELATCADIRIATEESVLGQPEHGLGLLPGWGATQRLRHIVGEGRAKEIILTAEHYDAETMEAYGYLNEVVAADEFDDRIHELAAELAAGPPIAQELTKRAMHAGRDDMAAGLALESQAFGLVIESEDVLEGIAAFTEKRDPEFDGR